MTARARSATSTATLRHSAHLRHLQDPSLVRAHFDGAPAFSAYARAYLDPKMFPLADFYEARSGDKHGMIAHVRGGLGPSTVALGDPSLIAALISLHPGPRQTFLTCEIEHVDPLLISHNLWRPQTMVRMQLDIDAFSPPAAMSQVRRLIDADAPELNRLYAIEEEGLRYSGRQVSQGIYFGAHVRGRLVAAAGTHIYSANERVAVIGNVFTHPDYRGKGLGSAVTAAVANHLLATCNLIVLNVDPANRTAHHIYEVLGFRDTGRLIEAMATRRESITPLPFIRRTIARWRAGTPQTELIHI